MKITAYKPHTPEQKIAVTEAGEARGLSDDCIVAELERDICFSTKGLESWALANWKPIIYDALVLAAAVEYADRVIKRSPLGWARKIHLQIPVHTPRSWVNNGSLAALHDAIGFLTGDSWNITLVKRKKAAPPPSQGYLDIPRRARAILAYSNGMDSKAVAGLVEKEFGDELVRVRISPGKTDAATKNKKRLPFTSVPYSVSINKADKESSARNRGFRFALISGVSAYLMDASEVIVPESGQGVIGPALVIAGHAYPDYRNHPVFLNRMSLFLQALLGKKINYIFPRIWSTKGETLHAYAQLPEGGDWQDTKSCWQGNRQASIDGKLRQCGICAACMLRRLSVHAAGLVEEKEVYVCEDLSAQTFDNAINPNFKFRSKAFDEYALAGVLHMDHMADLALAESKRVISRHAALLGPAINMPIDKTEENLDMLFKKHAEEWKKYLESLGKRSFIRKWTRQNDA